jgi:hypothetical protein
MITTRGTPNNHKMIPRIRCLSIRNPKAIEHKNALPQQIVSAGEIVHVLGEAPEPLPALKRPKGVVVAAPVDAVVGRAETFSRRETVDDRAGVA